MLADSPRAPAVHFSSTIDSAPNGSAATERVHDGPTRATPETPQVIRGNELEDYHYAFTIRRPSAEWEIQLQERAISFLSDALLVIQNPRTGAGAWLAVERLPGVSLDDCATFHQSLWNELEAVELDRAEIVLDGHPGILAKLEATMGDVRFRYRQLTVKRGDYFYHVIGFANARTFEEVEDDIDAIQASLKFIKDREPQQRAKPGVRNGRGADWVLSSNTYWNASHGFGLKLSDNWLVASDKERMQFSPDATVLLECGDLEFYQTYHVDIVATNDRPLIDRLLNQVGERFDKREVRPDVRTVRIGGVVLLFFH
jgi:hypothetical protein